MKLLQWLYAFIYALFSFSRKLWRNKKAVGMQTGIIGALVAILVSILVGVVVIQGLITSQTQSGWSATANTTWASLQSNIWTAITLIIIIPVIIGAVAIMVYVRQIS